MAAYKTNEEAIAWLRSRQDFRKFEAEYAALKAPEQQAIDASEPKLPADFDAERAVRALDDLPAFDISQAVKDFLVQLGLFHQSQEDEQLQEDADHDTVQVSWEAVVSNEDLQLLASVLQDHDLNQLAIPIDRASFASTSQDTLKQWKARLLDTIARLALHPALTLPIAQIFSRIMVDIAARWLLLLGFDGEAFSASCTDEVSKSQLVSVLAASGRLLKRFPHIYPCLLVVMQHPLLRTESPLDLLPPLPADFTVPAWPSSAVSPSSSVPVTVYNPSLPILLLTFLSLIEAVPQLSHLPIMREHYGSPLAPPALHAVLQSHPLASVRILAWHIICRWTGCHGGPAAGDLRTKYVYDPARDPKGGSVAGVDQNCPEPDFDTPKGEGEEWLAYWPSLAGNPKARSGTVQLKLERPWLDTWIYDDKIKELQGTAWLRARSHELASAVAVAPDETRDTDSDRTLRLAEDDLCPLVVGIQGIHSLREACLPRPPSPSAVPTKSLSHSQIQSVSPPLSSFVKTAPAVHALRQLALHAISRVPVLISSPTSAGKSTILEELHRQFYSPPTHSGRDVPRDRQIVTINLADRSLDAKTLLGSLSSSPTEPGVFTFVEGTLTRALRHGRWLVLEDIDKAADDVLCTIAELVERIKQRAEACVGGAWGGATPNIVSTGGLQDGVGIFAGGNWVSAAEGFMLFATRSVQSSAAADPDSLARLPTFFGSQYWSRVWLSPPTLAEVGQIVSGRFPKIHAAIAGKLVEVWDNVRSAANSASGPSTGAGMTRDVTIRDLVKWCDRAQQALPRELEVVHIAQNPVYQEELFIEARDVFLGSFPTSSLASRSTSSKYLAIVAALQDGLSLSAERVDWILTGRTPEVAISADAESSSTAHIGRARLNRLAKRKTSSSQSSGKQPYAMTKPFLSLLERLAVCTQLAEPVLMVGETGTGKTAAVGHLASSLGRNLVALNLSNQTEASDLLGGFKPVNEAEEVERVALQLVNDFVELFSRTFSMARNAEYTAAVTRAYQKHKWSRLVGLWREATRMASDRVAALKATAAASLEDSPRKKRKTSPSDLGSSWQSFLAAVSEFDLRHSQQGAKAAKFAFNFVEGPLVKAIQRGDWVLLDEVNLATPETLESLSTLLQASDASLVLMERGDLEPVRRHPDFRLFACMNPATDVGKRDLPPALRTRFTEIYVPPPDADKDALLSIVQGYIGHTATGDRGIVVDVADFYLAIKGLSAAGKLADGTNQPPHFSMRTLARALTFASDLAQSLGIRRAVYEGCLMAFTTLLEGNSAETVMDLLHKHFVEKAKNPRSFLSMPSAKPEKAHKYVHVGAYWLERGKEPPAANERYVLTPSVQSKLVNLARTVAVRRSPVLIQGPTSSGKTSIIEYLARQTGHRFVRINNHEHTDIQEYLGTYVSDPKTGKLVFREGILVKAVRNGDWIVLDELNLAPTDVLEALNRLLDDNRELVIPETQEVVKPHPHFMLFATQNPPGLYGGRKVLSRAFRNRFLEMHFTDVPKDELETILCERCQIAPSYAKKIVAVFVELQKRRQSTRVFEEKQAFVTLRDLFRWGGREAVGYDQLAADGYMLLAERARKPEDKLVVREVIESIMKVKLDDRSVYATLFESATKGVTFDTDLVWTSAMRRLFVLVHSALQHDEPVLLVGETGSGKTSVCQSIADVLECSLHILNCHQNTETADLIGSQRPVRNRANLQEALKAEAAALLSAAGIQCDPLDDYEMILRRVREYEANHTQTGSLYSRMQEASALFAWYDGPLVQAMKHGDIVLLDEISLADDSVLERLNSVLEPGRTLVVAEKGAEDLDDVKIRAHERFKILATMNPGGDYGKKELSPALRNRFTEVWVPWVTDHEDLVAIIDGRWRDSRFQAFTRPILDFAQWFTSTLRPREAPVLGTAVTLRDILAWVAFINAHTGQPGEAFTHGALMTLVDAIGTTPATLSLSQNAVGILKKSCIDKLTSLMHSAGQPYDVESAELSWSVNETHLTIAPFSLAKGNAVPGSRAVFAFDAPTTLRNAQKVARAMQLPKPILLEGSPGVGKTSLITALAALSQHQLCRINLSDQTDLIDLFGSDLPVEGGKSGEFAWRDAPFLAAMQAGDWVLLDEMNLASQSVLEGLNSCLDHRGTVFIPELDRSFTRHPNFRIFAAQNPANQGGSRKGLPRSFVDRFTQVYMSELGRDDYTAICRSVANTAAPHVVDAMVDFVSELHHLLASTRFGQQGSPWEVNLRDLLRWFSFLDRQTGLERFPQDPVEQLDTLFLQRFRNNEDRTQVLQAFQFAFNHQVKHDSPGLPLVSYHIARLGSTLATRTITNRSIPIKFLYHDQYRLRSLHALAAALDMNQLAILTGPQGSGKTSLVQECAEFLGRPIRSFSMNPQTDTLEMLGTFEQANIARARSRILGRLQQAILSHCDSEFDATALSSIWKRVVVLMPLVSSDAKRWRSGLSILENSLKSLDAAQPYFDMVKELYATVDNLAGRFEWLDGPLVHAMQNGEIFLIENANLCNASVLDRLNALFEPGGKLQLTERGMVNNGIVTIAAHPAFRVVMALDPKYGELSRAMRNRGVEIALQASPAAVPQQQRPIFSIHAPLLAASFSQSTCLVDSSRQSTAGLLHGLRADYASLASWPSRTREQARQLGPVSLLIGKHALVRAVIEQRKHMSGRVVEQAALAFPLDSNDARRVLPNDVRAGLISANELLKCLSAASRRQLRNTLVIHSALQTPISDLSVVQQSCVVDSHPNRLPRLAEGVQHVWPLLCSLLATIIRLSASALDSEKLHPNSNLAIILDNVSRELEALTISRHLDYATYELLLEWLAESVASASGAHAETNELASVISAARTAVKRTSGLFFEAIWRSYLPNKAPNRLASAFKALRASATACSLRKLPQDLFSVCLEVLSETFDETRNEDMAAVRELVESLTKRLDAHRASEVSTDYQSILPIAYTNTWITAAVAELHAVFPASSTASSRKAALIKLCGNENRSIESITAVLAPAQDGSSAWPALTNWLAYTTFPVAKPDSDVSMLITPGLLLDALTIASMAPQLPLIASAEAMLQIKKAAGAHLELATVANSDRCVDLAKHLGNMTNGLFSTISGGLPSPADNAVDALRSALATLLSVKSADTSVQHEDNHEALSAAINVVITDLLSDGISLSDLAAGYASWASVFWHLFLPNFPIDPAVASRAEIATLQRRRDRAVAASAVQSAESSAMGDFGSIELHMLTEQIAELDTAMSALDGAEIDRLSDPALIAALFSELQQAGQSIFNNVATLLESLRNSSFGPNVVARLQNLRDTLKALAARLQRIYHSFEDVLKPVLMCFGALSIGLELWMVHIRAAEGGVATQIHRAALRNATIFPTVSGADAIARGGLPTSNRLEHASVISHAQAVHLRLESLSRLLHRSVAETSWPDLDSFGRQTIKKCYDQIFGLWSVDRASEAAEKAEAESIYRSRKTEILVPDDEELEAQEMAQIFALQEDGTPSNPSSAPAGRRHLNEADIVSIFKMHFFLFDSPGQTNASVRQDVVRRILEAHPSQLSGNLDDRATVYRLSQLHSAIQRNTVTTSGSDFYADSQPAEISKMQLPILAMQKRARELAEEWPEQMILVEIDERCEALLQLPISTPVARVLTYLESFLPKIEDWERYASSQTSLRALQSDIVALIVEWRRLELSSWARLLDKEEQQYGDRMADWWFRFYETFIRSAITLEQDALSRETLASFLNNTVQVLETFFVSSPIGHFSRRLALVRSFANLANHLSKEGYSTLQGVSALLSNIYEFYKHKGVDIVAHVAAERKRLEKDLQDVIRLASWKDVNVDALKASAQKSHKQLYKTIRKLRTVLDKPAQDFLVTASVSLGQLVANIALPAWQPAPSLSLRDRTFGGELPLPLGTPAAILNLGSTLERLGALLSAQQHNMEIGIRTGIDELRNVIVQRSKVLRDELPKGETKEEKAKSANALVNRKRKAWSDLLKEIKRIGLSSRPSDRILKQQTDSLALYGARPLCELARRSFADTAVLEGADTLFYAILSRFPAIRGIPSNHHEDISSSQFATAVGSLQSSFSLILAARQQLASVLGIHSELHKRTMLLEQALDGGLVVSQASDSHLAAESHTRRLAMLSDALSELAQASQRHADLSTDPADQGASRLVQERVAGLRSNVEAVLLDLAAARNAVKALHILSTAEARTLEQAESCWATSRLELQRSSQDLPRFAYLTAALQEWMDGEQIVSTTRINMQQSSQDAEARYIKLVGSVLNVVQSVSNRHKPTPAGENGEMADGELLKTSRELQEAVAALHAKELDDQFSELCRSCTHIQPEKRVMLLQRVLPVMQAYDAFMQAQLHEHVSWHLSQLKLCHVLVGLVLTLAQEGFCKPQDGEAEASGQTETGSGTGMGAGKGDKNVSNEIEGEEQVEGLQDEAEDDNEDTEQDKRDKDDAVDMSNDFGGRMEDVAETEDEDEEKQDDEEGEEEAEPEEQVGKVDPLDPGAVDDKFWGGDDKEDQDDGETKEETGQRPQETGDSEMGERKEGRQQKPEKAQPDPDEQQDGQAGDEDMPETGADEQKDDGTAQPDEQEQDLPEDGEQAEQKNLDNMPDLDMDAQALDLPENLQLDAQPEDKDGGLGEDEDLDLPADDLDRANDEEGDPASDEQVEEAQGDTIEDRAAEGQEAPEDSDQKDEQAMEHTAGAESGTQGGETASASTLQPEALPENADSQDRADAGDAEMQTDANAGQPGRESAGRGQRRQQQSQPSQAAQEQSAAEQAAAQAESQEANADAAAVEAQEQEEAAAASASAERNLGDAAREWMRRLEAIRDATEDQTADDQPKQNAEDAELEYADDADRDVEMQAAGAADEDQAQQAGRQADESQMVDNFQALEVDEVTQGSQPEALQRHQIPGHLDADDGDLPDVEMGVESREDAAFDADDLNLPQRQPSPDVEAQDEILHQQLQHWYDDGRSSLSAEEVWRLYETLTRDLSFSLTESLRLVLEPTLATRLKGDYRTGKRLNMKKIIPYIASDFTKDKIWLRRTRPSAREYQIMLAVDDSRSMSDGRAVHLAYQTLALVTQSLTRLEAGQVSIARFGETVDFVHDFEDGPVSESAGSKIIEAFTFAQRSTDVRRLLQKSLQRLAEARESKRGSAADLWQMEIIISDGICQDMEDLRALLRKATEQKVMVVFIVVDSLHQQQKSSGSGTSTPKGPAPAAGKNSILNMNSVSYVRGKDGALELKMERYLDQFPFDYYMVLRDVQALPDVLSETLRQFFERVAGDR